MRTAKIVFFDVGGVLIDADLERYISIGCALFQTSPEALKREVSLRVPDLERGRITSDIFWKQVGESLWRTGEGRPAPAGACHGLWGNLLKSTITIDPKVKRICDLLIEAGTRIGILSNVISEHASVLAELGLYTPFEVCVLSCRTGLRKPDKEIYEFAAKSASLAPSQCLFVDDVAVNAEAARRAGMDAVVFSNAEMLCMELLNRKLLHL